MFQESAHEAWQARFGRPLPSECPFPATFLAHRSVREYADKPLDEGVVGLLIGAAQSAATSSNLQLWSVVSVQDPARREQLAKLCGDQEHVRRAPWLLCFLADLYRLKRAAAACGEDAAGLDYAEFTLMAAVDAALAAERLVCAAEAMGVGTCYIGALRNNPQAVQELLGLPPGAFGLFGLCLGYPAESCQAEIKPRLRASEVWFREKYDLEVDCSEYNERMRPFYESQGMKGSVTWSMRSARRVDGKHMSGREVLKPYLESRGFWLR